MRVLTVCVLALAIAIASGTPAFATQTDADAAIKARKAALQQIKGSFKAINSKDATAEDIAKNATALKEHSRKPWEHFGDGTDKGVAEKTEATAVIWSDPEGFKTAQDVFVAEVDKLAAITAQPGYDMAAAKAQAQAVGGACQSCHKKYKN